MRCATNPGTEAITPASTDGSQRSTRRPVPNDTWAVLSGASELSGQANPVVGPQHVEQRDGDAIPTADRQGGTAIRRAGVQVPVLVFAAPGDFASDNKRAAMRFGAAGYCTSWSRLFTEIERMFGDTE